MKSRKNSQERSTLSCVFRAEGGTKNNLTVTHDLRKKFQEGNKRKPKMEELKKKKEKWN